MNERIIGFLDSVIYWFIVLLPFSIAIASGALNVIMGLLVASFIGKKILEKKGFFLKTAINIPLLLLFIITCLSIIHSIDIKDTIKGGMLRLLQYIFIFFILASELKDRRHIYRITMAMAFGLILTSTDELWQVITGKDFIRGYAPIVNIGLRRATASFKDANTLGVYLSAIIPLIFGLTLYYLKGFKKIVFIIISFFGLIGIALTYSRPTLLAVYLSLLFLGLAKKNKILIIFLVIFALISPFLLPKSVKEWARQMNYNPLRFMCNDDRIAIYRNSFNMIRAHPVIGVGANTYMKNYKKYKESPEYRNIVTADYLYAHNNFLHIAAEIGLLGLATSIWLLYELFKDSLNIYKNLNDDFLKIISISLIVCLIAFLVNGLTESSLYSSRVAIIFWYIMGFSLSLKKWVKIS
jgi:putative inorganic carbon (HCO3(-)) transporter